MFLNYGRYARPRFDACVRVFQLTARHTRVYLYTCASRRHVSRSRTLPALAWRLDQLRASSVEEGKSKEEEEVDKVEGVFPHLRVS